MFVSTTNVSPRTDSIALRLQFVPCTHDQVVDLLHGFGTQFDQVVLDPPPIEVDFLVPIADAHDLPQACDGSPPGLAACHNPGCSRAVHAASTAISQ